jgi:DNA repair protein RadA
LELEEIKGVGPAVAKRLKTAGFVNAESVAVTPLKEFMERAGYKELGPALRIVEAATQAVGKPFTTAWERFQAESQRLKCTTGSRALDNILGGGVKTRETTEFAGKNGTGKTQLCHGLSAKAQLKPSEGGFGGEVLYFDTEGSFSAKRLYQIAENNGLNPEEALKNVIVSRVYNSDHQNFLLDHVFDLCAEQNIKLVIVDSAASHFRSEYIGREMLAERQQRLNAYLHKLLRLAEIYNLAVVVTNQAIDKPVATYIPEPYLGDPIGGNIMGHASTNRLWIRRGKGNVRIARLKKSPYLPERECTFSITDRGIEDADGYEPEDTTEMATAEKMEQTANPSE